MTGQAPAGPGPHWQCNLVQLELLLVGPGPSAAAACAGIFLGFGPGGVAQGISPAEPAKFKFTVTVQLEVQVACLPVRPAGGPDRDAAASLPGYGPGFGVSASAARSALSQDRPAPGLRVIQLLVESSDSSLQQAGGTVLPSRTRWPAVLADKKKCHLGYVGGHNQ